MLDPNLNHVGWFSSYNSDSVHIINVRMLHHQVTANKIKKSSFQIGRIKLQLLVELSKHLPTMQLRTESWYQK